MKLTRCSNPILLLTASLQQKEKKTFYQLVTKMSVSKREVVVQTNHGVTIYSHINCLANNVYSVGPVILVLSFHCDH